MERALEERRTGVAHKATPEVPAGTLAARVGVPGHRYRPVVAMIKGAEPFARGVLVIAWETRTAVLGRVEPSRADGAARTRP